MILPSGRPSGDRPRPWPAAPVQPAVKLKSLPAHCKAGGAGVLFSSLWAFYLFQARSLPQPWSERKSRGNGAQHPEVGSPPAAEERLTPSAPAGSPPQSLPPQGCLAGGPSSKGLQLQDWPHPAPQAALRGTAQGSAGLQRSPQRCATSGRTAEGRPATHPPRSLTLSQDARRSCCPTFQCFHPPPAASHERRALFPSFHAPSKSQRLPT